MDPKRAFSIDRVLPDEADDSCSDDWKETQEGARVPARDRTGRLIGEG
jgi:hypothetical protein